MCIFSECVSKFGCTTTLVCKPIWQDERLGPIEFVHATFTAVIGERAWDRTLERKAGGIAVTEDLDLAFVSHLRVANASSTMALVRAAVGEMMRTGELSDSRKKDIKSIKVYP